MAPTILRVKEGGAIFKQSSFLLQTLVLRDMLSGQPPRTMGPGFPERSWKMPSLVSTKEVIRDIYVTGLYKAPWT